MIQIKGFITWLRTFFDNIYQAKLVSGANIRTINNQSILGNGNLDVGGTGTIDDTVTQNSSNPVKSSGIYNALTGKVSKTELLNLIYPIGAIYYDGNNNNVCPIQTSLGGTWTKIEGRFLLASGTTSGTSTNYAYGATNGSANAVVVEHNHTQDAHTHGTGNSTYKYFYAGKVGIGSTANKKAHTNNNSGIYIIYTNDEGGDTIKEYTATGSATPGIQNKGVSGTGANMPPYLVVNVWKRTA